MIEPGKISLELILNDPKLYMLWLYAIPLVLGSLAAFFADRAADSKLKNEARESDPTITKDKLDDVYEFEDIRDPIAWGILATIVVVFPMANTLDAVGDWGTVWASSILAGLTSRALLMKLAGSFIAKVTQKK